jgi:hypothetical protein
MKKMAFVLVALFMATPAMAAVEVTASCEVMADTNFAEVTISFDATAEVNCPRAFALDITIEGEANFVDADCVNEDFYVFPGSIEIDAGGTVTNWGSCACSSSYPGTLGGFDTNGITLEMGSLYVGEANAPNQSGDLAVLTIEGCGDVNIVVAENAIRGGIVMENPDEVVAVVTAGCSATLKTCIQPNCQMPTECAGHASGDSTCDGEINLADLFALKAAFGTAAPWTDPDCCSDYNNDQSCNLADLFVLKAGFGTGGYAPSTGNQSCAGLP